MYAADAGMAWQRIVETSRCNSANRGQFARRRCDVETLAVVFDGDRAAIAAGSNPPQTVRHRQKRQYTANSTESPRYSGINKKPAALPELNGPFDGQIG